MKKVFALTLSFLLPFLSISEEKDDAIELLYEKINELEQEISRLRSLIEENSYFLQKSQEINKQRYLEVDKRIHEIDSVNIKSSKSMELLEDEVNPLEDQTLLSQEISFYKTGLEFFDVARYSDALETFREQIIAFPDGNYVADAYFWSGEIFFQQNFLDDARENYLVVVNKYPNHKRVASSFLKLGEISRKLNQAEEARSYFLEVIEKYPDSGPAQLAKKLVEFEEEGSNSED